MAYAFNDDKSKAERKQYSYTSSLIAQTGGVSRVGVPFSESYIFDSEPTDEEMAEYVKDHFVAISKIEITDPNGDKVYYPICGYEVEPFWGAFQQKYGIRMYIYFLGTAPSFTDANITYIHI